MNLDEAKRWAERAVRHRAPDGDAFALLLARVAELEAGEVSTEWGIQLDDGEFWNDMDEQGARETLSLLAESGQGGRFKVRDVRTGPWTAADHG